MEKSHPARRREEIYRNSCGEVKVLIHRSLLTQDFHPKICGVRWPWGFGVGSANVLFLCVWVFIYLLSRDRLIRPLECLQMQRQQAHCVVPFSKISIHSSTSSFCPKKKQKNCKQILTWNFQSTTTPSPHPLPSSPSKFQMPSYFLGTNPAT